MPSPLTTDCSCSPISAKTADSRTKATIFQTAASWSRVAKSTCHDRCPRYSATTTTASTPEACTRSAAAYATKGISRDSVFWSSASRRWVRSQCSGTISTRPTPMPPTAASRKSPTPAPQLMPSPTAAARATLKAVIAVASFTRDSPWRIVVTRAGSPTRRAIAAAVTASGGAITAPSTRAAVSGRSGTVR